MANKEWTHSIALVDASATQFRILPFDRQAYTSQDFELAVSPDGKNLLVICGDLVNLGVCSSSITLPKN
jgi:hypothetical protein